LSVVMTSTDWTEGVARADNRMLSVPVTFVANVSAGWRYDSRTNGCAAR